MSLHLESHGSDFTPQELESAALAQVKLLNRLSSDLTQQISDTYQTYDELVRAEISRLCGQAFDIVEALNRGDPQRAYQLACGDPDEDGTSLGVVA